LPDFREGVVECQFDTPEKLLRGAAEGRLGKQALASLLAGEPRTTFLKTCAEIERRYTEECAAELNPCMDSGCMSDGEICLQPLLRREAEYCRSCGTVWSRLCARPENRSSGWQDDVAGWP
jgi:hypothetical protein